MFGGVEDVKMSMMLGWLAAGVMAAASPQQPPAPQDAPATIDDVVVQAQRERERARVARFVDSVAAPPRGRGAATWRDVVCVGVTNMQADAAQYMADRISTVATDMGLNAGPPGCRPNILISAADDGDAFARDLVAARRDEFRVGSSGTDLGEAALERFQTSGRLVRWWHVSVPVDSWSGRPIVRMRGQTPFQPNLPLTRPSDLGDYGRIVMGSRLQDQSRDDMQQVVIVIDIDALAQASFTQLTDYVAMIALAQIDPDAELGGYDTILSLFGSGGTPPEFMTAWDWAYLQGLYGAEQTSRAAGAREATVAAAMERALREDRAAADRP